MAVVVKVANQRHMAAGRLQPLADRRHRGGGLGRIDGDADDLRARVGERLDLLGGGARVRGIGIGHRLDDDRRAAPDPYRADRTPTLTRRPRAESFAAIIALPPAKGFGLYLAQLACAGYAVPFRRVRARRSLAPGDFLRHTLGLQPIGAAGPALPTCRGGEGEQAHTP